MSNIKNKTKILPMTLPPITLYPFSANKLSVLLNYEEALPWFYSNFIQTWISKSGPKGYWSDFLFFSGGRFCPFYKTSNMNKRMIQYKWNSIIEFIVDSIDLGYYVYLNIDASFIPIYEKRLDEHWSHDIFVFGYDKKNETLKVADFFKNRSYYYSEVSFNDFQQSYDNFNLTNTPDFLNGISIETFENTTYKFDINFIYSCFKDYLAACNTTIATDLTELDNKEDIAYGIEVYDILDKYLNQLKKKEKDYIDIRPFHMIYDHKTAMISRLRYLEKLCYLNNAEKFISEYTNLQSECLILRNSILKFTITKHEGSLEKARTRLESINIKEKQVLNNILDSIL